MTISLYDASIPVFTRGLKNLQGFLGKAGEHAASAGFDAAVLLQSRLFPDMLPLIRQIQIVSDMVKNGCARLGAIEPPKWEDTETSMAELSARIERTIAFIAQFTPEQINAAEGRALVLALGRRTVHFVSGWNYLSTFVLPNFYFHSAIAYGIVRHGGVKLGKPDFLGEIGSAPA